MLRCAGILLFFQADVAVRDLDEIASGTGVGDCHHSLGSRWWILLWGPGGFVEGIWRVVCRVWAGGWRMMAGGVEVDARLPRTACGDR